MILTDAQLTEQHALIERAKHDPAAFGELFDAHYSMIFNYVVRRTSDVAVAQDITSVVFIRALDNLEKFKWQGAPFSAWLYRIAGNEIRMHYRRHKPLVSLDELAEESGFELVADADLQAELEDAQAAIDRAREYLRAQTAVSRLPIKYQEVLALRFGENKKLGEIATILQKKEGTVKSLLSRALSRLKNDLTNHEMQPFEGSRIMGSEGRTYSNKSQERI